MVMPCSRSASSPSASKEKSVEPLELVRRHRAAIVEQPADQGRLAVVDRAAGEEAEQSEVHQK